MLGRWTIAVCGSIIVNSLVLASLAYGIVIRAGQEPVYMEVTLAELFAPVESGTPQPPRAENRPTSTEPGERVSGNAAATNPAAAEKGTTAGGGVKTTQAPAKGNGQKETGSVLAGRDRGPRVIFSTEPFYPEKARQNGWQGTVRLRILVGATGQIEDVTVGVSSGYAELDRAALDSVRKWRFAPAVRNDMAIAVWVILPVVFNLK